MEPLSDLLHNRFQKAETPVFEYKALGDEMYDHFKPIEGTKIGRKIYPLFSSPKYPHIAIKDAWVAYQKGNVRSFQYFMGILNKLVNEKV